ncbi:MAG: hypothetical protein M3R24_23415 [Chloroflexota bacterium]|nr:hypothetical protein [Chloroflexota bacterium]
MINTSDTINGTLLFRQAWLVTAEYFDPDTLLPAIREYFVALLDDRIASTTMLNITTELYKSKLLSAIELPLSQNNRIAACSAKFRILNDGSVNDDDIVCGHNPGLTTRRVYDVTLFRDAAGETYLSCRAPHVLVNEQNVREIEYWDEITLRLPA